VKTIIFTLSLLIFLSVQPATAQIQNPYSVKNEGFESHAYHMRRLEFFQEYIYEWKKYRPVTRLSQQQSATILQRISKESTDHLAQFRQVHEYFHKVRDRTDLVEITPKLKGEYKLAMFKLTEANNKWEKRLIKILKESLGEAEFKRMHGIATYNTTRAMLVVKKHLKLKAEFDRFPLWPSWIAKIEGMKPTLVQDLRTKGLKEEKAIQKLRKKHFRLSKDRINQKPLPDRQRKNLKRFLSDPKAQIKRHKRHYLNLLLNGHNDHSRKLEVSKKQFQDLLDQVEHDTNFPFYWAAKNQKVFQPKTASHFQLIENSLNSPQKKKLNAICREDFFKDMIYIFGDDYSTVIQASLDGQNLESLSSLYQQISLQRKTWLKKEAKLVEISFKRILKDLPRTQRERIRELAGIRNLELLEVSQAR